MREATVCLMVGFMVGLIFAAVLVRSPWSRFVDRADVAAKATIRHDGYFAQYSCVRRFPAVEGK